MAELIYDIFGTSRAQTGMLVSEENCLKGIDVENIQITGKNRIEPYVRKQALGNVGNIFKNTNTALQDSKSKQSFSNCNQENSSFRQPSKSPVRKVKNAEGTPIIKPVLRTPLSDLTPKDEFQQKSTQPSEIRNSFLQEFDNFINATNLDLPLFAKNEGAHYEDDYADILTWTNHSEDVVSFSKNLDLHSDDDTGFIPEYLQFGLFERVFDIKDQEGFTIPVVSEDES